MAEDYATSRNGSSKSYGFLTLIFTLTIVVFASGKGLAQTRPCSDPTPVNTISEMFDAIFACWQPPADSAGMSMTLKFALRRNGTLIGKPMATYSDLTTGDENQKRAFVASIMEALDKALPLPFTDSMGGAVAGRQVVPRFVSPY